MLIKFLILVSVSSVLGRHVHHRPSVPVFSDIYLLQGIISLPYVEIKEPFTAYYDAQNNRSRVDYYGDLQQTYQRADQGPYGQNYKIAYMPPRDGADPEKNCFQVSGSQEDPVAIQSVLPDLAGFELLSSGEPCPQEEYQHSESCELWGLTSRVGSKVNHYSMWLYRNASGEAVPVRYEMMGYDSLLGSHYDKYQVYYGDYSTDPLPLDIFEVDNTLTCHGFPGPGLRKHTHLINPIREFIHNDDSHVQDAFSTFKSKYDRKYEHEREHAHREGIFRHNFRYIHSTNRAGLGFQLAVNHFADRTEDEMHYLRGRLYSPGYNGGQAFYKNAYNLNTLPDQMDWRLYGAVTPVKDQAICGSCWSFGTTGTLEGAYFLKYKELKRFSQQQLIDCSWPYQNNGCDGGEDFRAYQYIRANGLATEEDYGSYLGVDGECHQVPATLHLTSYVNVTSGDSEALKIAIFNHGPISVAIDASQRSFSFYSNGVYYEPKCKNKDDELDHAVLAVGYGVMNGEPYWLIKNSWSTYWGNDGYVLMSQRDNNCGVATSPTYVILE